MIICHDPKLIFIHVHRTGGSTIINLLKDQLGKKVEIVSQHGNALTQESKILKNHPDYLTFGVARNPWDRMLSWFVLINKNKLKSIDEDRLRFQQFLEQDLAAEPGDNYFNYNQLDYFISPYRRLDEINILSYENYTQEVYKIFNILQLKIGEIPSLNSTIKKDYKHYYTEKSKSLIAEKCKKDIEYFNFIY